MGEIDETIIKNIAIAAAEKNAEDKSMAFSLLKMNQKIIKWQLISHTIIICALIAGFCFYVWLPETEEATEYTVESQDKGHAIYNDNGAEVKINGESDSEEN